MGSNSHLHQVAALPVRLDDERRAQVCLVTSRSTGRWIIPKGWPMKGVTDADAARIEAKEEAGLVGAVMSASPGSYTYWRRTRVDFQLTRVDVYLSRVERQRKSWKERDQRTVSWVSLLDAADLVLEPKLSSLLLNLPANVPACAFLGHEGSTQF